MLHRAEGCIGPEEVHGFGGLLSMIGTDILLALLINVATGELCKAFAFRIAKFWNFKDGDWTYSTTVGNSSEAFIVLFRTALLRFGGHTEGNYFGIERILKITICVKHLKQLLEAKYTPNKGL